MNHLQMHAHPTRLALIDMGTNTFHLLIVELPAAPGQPPHELLRTKAGVRLGEGGISRGEIAPAPYARALHTMAGFKEEMELHSVTQVRATATSAMRVARNGPALVREISEQFGIEVEVIAGGREAELIWRGVRQAVPLGPQRQLIVDIGGGSVEFIIANDHEIFWKQSFEIGAQRLLDQFFPDPSGVFPAAAVAAEQAYFDALQLSQAAKLLSLQAKLKNRLSGVMDIQGRQLEALSFLEEALEIYISLDDKRRRAVCLCNIGGIKAALDQFDISS